MSPSPQEPGQARPELVILDVNETLSDLSPLGPAFRDAGLDGGEVPAWFAGVLRDAFALNLLGENPAFADIAAASLRVRLSKAGSAEPAVRAQELMDRFTALDPHPDVVPGLQALSAAGCRVVTLSNGSAAVARALLEDTPAGAVIAEHLSVEDAGAWKPAERAYVHALTAMSVTAGQAMLVAVHPWDIAGARRAGLRTAWINRDGSYYPDHFPAAEIEAASLVELAAHLVD